MVCPAIFIDIGGLGDENYFLKSSAKKEQVKTQHLENNKA